MHSHYLNGQWIAGDGAPFTVTDPSTGEVIWTGAEATPGEIDAACGAARAAFEPWSMLPPEERIAVCRRFRDLLQQHAETLALLISREVGKPLWEARTEVASMANKIEISAQAYGARTGESRAAAPDGIAVLRHRPHGVFGVFGPYNFPGHLPNGHIAPALIAGNTVVLKPSEHAPQTALLTVQLWSEAGLPQGVLNLVNGGRETGAALARHAALDGILFTGSYQTGALLHRQYAGQPGKMLALEMGGNNPLIAWDVEQIDAAVHHAVFSAFVSAGQRCTCARRLIVEDSPRGQALIERLVEVSGKIAVGRYDTVPAPFMGPVVSARIAERLLQAQSDLIARGGTSLLAMRSLRQGTGFLSPGIVDVTAAANVPDEEWFGPMLQVIRVRDFDDAICTANATQYGLAAGLLSENAALWPRFQARMRAGIVNWNRPTTGAASTAPFGGVGSSGNHRPSAYYAADYCAYPVASIENSRLELPAQLSPGLLF
ncbi:succinylglutamate-semialdehyde dehydrogenase [Noviherbaspirillum sp. CPCC 100848]|uniref:N-succinylglutamate 5-semialdehyde dehydrogenase n=1 Tax=Noviherbaspirillum album TaxID=3080276 RepID=A0ABU6J7X3_9BURK|nr:succinylglutamate-semialdehyde dehydrogenase [Noviherbaspirillum sp. CPCC 100848]MEC4719625.1 succinylglutamate-semialdehyde dehydrogenase [Noviherbaspirillum sp. CPCC 100848]